MVFRNLHPPYTVDFLLRDFPRFIGAQPASAEPIPLLEGTIDGIPYGCHRVPKSEGILEEDGLGNPYLWCSWHTSEEVGVLADRVCGNIRKTLAQTQRARAAAA